MKRRMALGSLIGWLSLAFFISPNYCYGQLLIPENAPTELQTYDLELSDFYWFNADADDVILPEDAQILEYALDVWGEWKGMIVYQDSGKYAAFDVDVLIEPVDETKHKNAEGGNTMITIMPDDEFFTNDDEFFPGMENLKEKVFAYPSSFGYGELSMFDGNNYHSLLFWQDGDMQYAASYTVTPNSMYQRALIALMRYSPEVYGVG